MIELFKEAVLSVDLPESGLGERDVDVVVEVYDNHKGYEVEFMTKEDRTISVETLMAEQVRAIGGKDMLHVRELSEEVS